MHQIYSIAMFYVVGVLADVMLYGLGMESIESNDLICV